VNDEISQPIWLRQKRWLFACLGATVLCFLYFLYANRDGCWVYWARYRILLILAFPWLWLLLMFGLRVKGRLVLLGLTVLIVLFWPHVFFSRVASAEASAIGRLRQLQTSVDEYKAQHREYPETLPNIPSPSPWKPERLYDFTFVPVRSSNGTITSYAIQATPISVRCAPLRSFTATSDKRYFVTSQHRAATASDPQLE
jgi:hypothetical protein